MSFARVVVAASMVLCGAAHVAQAVEGSSTAGPLGGTDVRSAMLPPPGLYGGGVIVHAVADKFMDGEGRSIPALASLHLTRDRGGAFLLYVPETQVLGGSIGFLGFMNGGQECGRLFASTPNRCVTGAGDPYVEANWSRYFGTPRPSQFPGAYPIPEGLTVAFGVGAVVPFGRYNMADAQQQGLVIGNNIWDVAPIAAFTYVTPPIIADGTELSARAYWNNYRTNTDTRYATGSLVDIDFALTERIGKWQVGLAGFYAFQPDDDKIAGIPVSPDGHRANVLQLGGVVAYDMPEYATSLKVKALTTALTENTVGSWGVSVALVTKLK